MKIFSKKEINAFLLFVGILFLLIGCSKNQKNTDEKNEITANAVEESQENCRLSDENDCRPIEIKKGEAETEKANTTQEIMKTPQAQNKTNLSEEDFVSLYCQESWKCVQANYRAYQFSNCSWNSIEYCVYGCKNDSCKPVPVCKQNSLKCDKDNLMVCYDGYEWKLNESCDYKCENSICISKNETIANATNSSTTNSTNTTQGNNFIADNCISVISFNYDTGNNASNESFTLKNSCSYAIDMSSWTAKDSSTHAYTFPSFNLGNAAQVIIVTGSGSDNSTTLYWGSGSPVWNNGGDTLYLNTSNSTSVLIYSYP